MPVFLLLGVALLVGVVLLGYWFVNTDPKRLAGTLRLAAITAALAVGLFLLFRGELGLIASLTSLLYPILARWRRLWAMARGQAQPESGQSSTLETTYLRVELDHGSGRVTGEVIAGHFAGRRLEEMGLGEVLRLLEEVRPSDPGSAQVLETYLDRAHGDAWREAAAGAGASAGSPPSGAMSRAEALKVLGLEPGAAESEIREAHRRLMLANHPDRGGSTYLAAQINRAKDVLLGG